MLRKLSRKTHKKRGGFKSNLVDIDFKYTVDPARKLWTKSVYPMLNTLTSKIRDIPWNTYILTDDAIISIIAVMDHETITMGSVVDEYSTRLDTEPLNYFFFGGIVYELLSDLYKNVELSWFVDPTGDIDVRVQVPTIKQTPSFAAELQPLMQKCLNNECECYTRVLMFNTGLINPYYKSIIIWIMDRLESVILETDIAPNAIPFNIDEYDQINAAYKTPELGYQVIPIGNAYLVAFTDIKKEELFTDSIENTDVFKIQLVLKLNDGTIDHLVEFIITSNTNIVSNKLTPEPIKLNNHNVDLFGNLVNDNLDAYINRETLFTDDGYIHKPINHVGRLLYLYELMKHNKQDKLISNSISDANMSAIYNMDKMFNKSKSTRLTEMFDTDALKKREHRINHAMDLNNYAWENTSFKFYKLNANGSFTLVYIKLADFIRAYLDVFSMYPLAFPLTFVNTSKLQPNSTPYENEEHNNILMMIHSNAARPSAGYISSLFSRTTSH
jgi:hypothetical protein